jgi:hypothetical protein
MILKRDARNALWVIPRHIAEHAQQFTDEQLYHRPTHGGNVDTCT